jgi:anti-sigma regulatory factor (Ser/Thr protein kinase)
MAGLRRSSVRPCVGTGFASEQTLAATVVTGHAPKNAWLRLDGNPASLEMDASDEFTKRDMTSASVNATEIPSEFHSNAVVESSALGIVRFQQRLQRILDRCGCHTEDRFAIVMAVVEALCNAIMHGNQCSRTKDVHITFSVTTTHFWIHVSDEGTGFDHAALFAPTNGRSPVQPTGLGLSRMRQFMHEVRFNRDGNSVSMRRRLSPGNRHKRFDAE